MTWISCTCGWVGIASTEYEAKCMHPLCRLSMRRTFNQPHMASEGVERLLAEARWSKS